MDNINILPRNFNYKYKKALKLKRGHYSYISSILNDALNKKTVKYNKSYRDCAKFIKKFHNNNLNFEIYKEPDQVLLTCCHSYPEICGGVCCGDKHWPKTPMDLGCRKCTGYKGSYCCGCDKIPENKNISEYNCYNDCCSIIKINKIGNRYIKWL